MASFLDLDAAGAPRGVHCTAHGTTLHFADLAEFARDCKPPPPYLDFIRRPKPVAIEPVDWDALLDGINVGEEGSAEELSLFDYQVEGIQRVVEEFDGRALLAADMGMGKTLMALVLMKRYGGRQLVIAPSTLVNVWTKEYARVFGAAPQAFKSGKDTIKQRVVVTTYGMIRDHLGVFAAEHWDMVVVDESHNIKRDSGQGRAVCDLVSQIPVKILLSGTPQESSPVELYNQLFCLYPEVFRNQAVFEQRYTAGHYNDFNRWVPAHATLEPELNILLNTLMVRMLDSRQKDLPPIRRYIQPVACVGKNKQQLDLLQADRKKINARLGKAKTALEGLARGGAPARQLAQAKVAVKAEEREIQRVCNTIRHTAGRVKAGILAPWVQRFVSEQAPHEKFVFFVEHRDTGEDLSAVLEGLGFAHELIHGDVNKDARSAITARIADPKDPLRFLIASYRTCSAGITLCPGARFCVFVELAFLPTTMMQAEKRVNRLGAVEEAHAVWLELAHSTDDKILRTLQVRLASNCRVVDGKRGEQFTFATMERFLEPEDGAKRQRLMSDYV